MLVKLKYSKFLIFSLLLIFAPIGHSQETSSDDLVKQKIVEINDYTALIKQINSEKKDKIGYEARALNKQLAATEESYRNLLWQFVDDIVDAENKKILEEHQPFSVDHLLKESEVLKKEIEQSNFAVNKLEDQIINAKKKIFTVNQAITKDRLSDINWKLYLQRINQEKLYTALVSNSQKTILLDQDASQDLKLAESLVKKQADMLSGLIGVTKDKLIKLEKKISVIRNESDTGKKLIKEIAIKNLEIQDYAKRLQTMVDVLGSMEVDSSLYKKTVLQSKIV